MSKVHLLPEHIVSKIAAGEVIDRPSAVVKECVENALDAGALAIEVHLKDAGKKSIIIKDLGSGIAQDDLDKVFLRHATSKIATADDLFNIHSLGFRGEALYSIGAVADVTVKSKTRDAKEGWMLHVRGGKQLDLKPCPYDGHGTDIEIQELFYNTPARKKFLKSNTSEVNHILDAFIPYALLFPNIRFLLTHQDRCLLDAPATDAHVKRAAHVLGLDEQFLLEAKHDTSDTSIHIIFGDMNIKRRRRDMQFMFVNGRPVQSKSVSYHLNQVFRLIMPPDEFPFFAVFINMPAADVDVNIHPSKREVKIKNEILLCGQIKRLCEQTLLSCGQIKTAGAPPLSSGQPYAYPGRAFNETFDGPEPSESTTQPTSQYTVPQFSGEQHTFFIPKDAATNPSTLQNKLINARYVGIFINKYILFEVERSILLVDQHAAAERVTYERLITQMQKGQVEVQHLLSPVLIKVTPQEMQTWETCQDQLALCGLDSSSFDGQTIAIHTHPQMLKDTEKAVRSILAGEPMAKSDFATIARRACRSSIMTGDVLSREEAESLRGQLTDCLDPFTCPHGRPTVVELTESFLDRQFLRT